MITLDNAIALRKELRTYLDVAEHIRQQGHGLDMSNYMSSAREGREQGWCGTVCCMAGWKATLEHENGKAGLSNVGPAKRWVFLVADKFSWREWGSTPVYGKAYVLLFGANQNEITQEATLDKLTRRANLLMFRCERVIEWHASMAPGVPKAMRQDHSRLSMPA